MTGALRLGRGLFVAIVIVIVSAAFHVVGGGCLQHLTSLGFMVLAAATVLCAIMLSSREWTLPRLIGLVAVTQVLFHGLFDGLDRATPHTSLIADPDAAAHLHSSPPMLLAHFFAAVIVAILLRRGERWLLAFAELLQSLLPRPLLLARVPFATPFDLLQAPKESGLRRILFASLLTHRGPPARFVASATA